MTRPNIIFVDHATNEEIVREMTEEEFAEWQEHAEAMKQFFPEVAE